MVTTTILTSGSNLFDVETRWHGDSRGICFLPIFEEGKITGAVVTVTDIAERKRLEKELIEGVPRLALH